MSSKVVDTGSNNSGSCHALGRRKKKLKQIISVAKRQTAAEVTADSWGRVLKKLFLGVGGVILALGRVNAPLLLKQQ